jgi:hypothetical protein
LPVSRFHQVLIQVLLSFVAPRSLQVLFDFGAAVSETVGRGHLLGITPFGALSFDAEIDNITHKQTRW